MGGRADGLLATPEFQKLLQRTHRGSMLKRELTADFIPNGYDADEVWEAVLGIRRA
ncbi:MAG: hypothetical protein IJ131_00925 [Eggerthellaceae bacterium]|nr:hypothetical protein [Eggerthellaceae bacterium]